jgi:hypothetical protein
MGVIKVSLLIMLTVLLSTCESDTKQCKDGTTTTSTGRGACSHHGGVK